MTNIAILGGGESGWGSALLAKVKGYRVFLSDSGILAPRYREALALAGIPFEEGGHSQVLEMDAELVVKSPGIPDTAPVVRHFADRGVPVISEIEFAGRYSTGRTVCITGSNGKTTTATLIHEILRTAGYDAALTGNIGDSYAAQVAECDRQWYVLELSSFQLDGMFSFRADIALLLNITPDHLDRYGYDMGKYAASKMRIAANQRPEDVFIYNGIDPLICGDPAFGGIASRKVPFRSREDSSEPRGQAGAWLSGGNLHAVYNGTALEMPLSALGIKGNHNTANAMAAALAALAAGVDPETIRAVLGRFTGVEHRMEEAGTVAGIRFINDSKATNTDAAWYAIEGTPGPLVWIAGGTDKGNDYGGLKNIAQGKVKALVCMGVDNSKLIEAFTGKIPQVYDTRSLDEAMRTATACAAAGDTVLLSPACASFDLFRNYEDRGRQFKEWVAEFKWNRE
ncbi:MAG: UDP-N-acetylmuramoyl-L-alanine--D-glutamate ligase [Alistipes sp.]|nr:UDP-N-acetylmuramoyl-L-alanine--D-glutamate ligase [Alistipes sp.]